MGRSNWNGPVAPQESPDAIVSKIGQKLRGSCGASSYWCPCGGGGLGSGSGGWWGLAFVRKMRERVYGWGGGRQAKEPASQCARVCQNYPPANYSLVSPRTSAKQKCCRGRDSRPSPRPRLSSQPQGDTKFKVARLQSEFCTKEFLLSYEFSYEKCSEIFPKIVEPLFCGSRKVPAKFPNKFPCEKSKTKLGDAPEQFKSRYV